MKVKFLRIKSNKPFNRCGVRHAGNKYYPHTPLPVDMVSAAAKIVAEKGGELVTLFSDGKGDERNVFSREEIKTLQKEKSLMVDDVTLDIELPVKTTTKSPEVPNAKDNGKK